MKNLAGRVVMVTGGASGIGAATAERFAQEGSRVIVADLDIEGAKVVANHIGGRSVAVDVVDPASVEAAIAFAVDSFGALDVLVNNAGVESARATTHEATLENWRHVVDINMGGVFHGLKYGLAQMMKQGSGNIVNTASIASIVGVSGLSAYAAAKAGVANLTRTAAIEYGSYGIRVNAVAPTAVNTPLLARMAGGDEAKRKAMAEKLSTMNPLHGVVTPEDIAAAIAFLASDDARFISGVILPVDGGLTAQ